MPLAEIATRFNDAINRADLDVLAALMSDDHVFTDTVGARVVGKSRCLEAWRGFFEQFPDYRNHFVDVISSESRVMAVGYSTCSVAVLEGPALWVAEVVNEKVAHWRVYSDTPENRSALGLA